MSSLTWVIAGGALVYTTLLTPGKEFPKMEVDITVHDEQGLPVEGAKVQTTHMHWIRRSPLIYFLVLFNRKGSDYEVTTTRYTNEQGISKLRFHTWDSRAKINITKEGWYSSSVTLPSIMPKTKKKWTKKPQKINIKLRPIINPIPLLVGDLDKPNFPEKFEMPVGYDLLLKDWMPPYGNGKIEDVIITLKRNEAKKAGNPAATVEYIFTGHGNGVCAIPQIFAESILPTPHQAPENGYENNQRLYTESIIYAGPGSRTQQSNLEGNNFFFRIRTKYDDEGNIISAIYGIILDGVRIIRNPRKIQIISPYWLNPTPNNRNLEPARTEWSLQTGGAGFIPYTGPMPNNDLNRGVEHE